MRRRAGRPLILSHRGVHGDGVRENTLAAFGRAAALGVDGFETDVRRTADDRLILFHDRRTADGKAVHELSHDQLSRALGYAPPTLEAALGAWPDLFWDLEIKTGDAVEAVLATLRRSGGDNVMVTSFLHDAVARVAESGLADCGLLLAHRPRDIDRCLRRWSAFARVRTVVMDYAVLGETAVHDLKDSGFAVFVYGLAGAEEHAACHSLGIDGVITDEPTLAFAPAHTP